MFATTTAGGGEKLATIIAHINQKGGVGKTTSTINNARVLCNDGKKVLAIDADAQGNMSGVLAAEPVEQDQMTFADLLMGESVEDVVVPGIWEGLSVVPGNMNTPKAVASINTEHGREYRLREALSQVAADYDYVLIDCAPSLDLHTVNALAASHQALVITEPGKFSLDGLSELEKSFDSISRYYNPLLTVAGIVVNKNRGTISHRSWIRDLHESARWSILDPYFPMWSVIQDAEEAGVGLDEWPGEQARQAYELYARILAKLGAINLSEHLTKVFPKHDYSTYSTLEA